MDLRLRALFFALLAVLGSQCLGQPPVGINDGLVSDIASLLELSPDEANEPRLAEIEGVVLSIDRQWKGVFLQDGDSVAYADYNQTQPKIVPGSRIKVTGTTKSGIVTPIVTDATLEWLGLGTLPEPRAITAAQIHATDFHNRLVRIAGIVNNVSPAGDHTIVNLLVGHESLNVKVNGMTVDHPYQQYRGYLELAGVLSLHNTSGEELGSLIHVPSVQFVDWPNAKAAQPGTNLVRAFSLAALAMATLGVVGIVWVISLRRSVARRTAQLTSVQDAVDAGIVVVSRENRLLRANQHARSIFGETEVGQNFGVYLDRLVQKAASPSELFSAIESIRADSHAQVRCEVEIIEDDARTCLRVASSPFALSGVGDEERIWTFTDITDIRSLERKLQLSEKMQALGTLAGGVAHDFNNLLTAINTNLELAKLAPDNSSQSIDAAREAANRGADLVRRLIGFSSQRDAVVAQSCDVAATLRLMQELMHPLVGADIQLSFDSEDDLFVPLHATQLEEVVMNLVYNAIGAVGQAGSIQVTARRSEDSGLTEQQSTVVIEVSDSGCGITSANQSRIFEPFFTTKEPGRGSGLGLSTSYGIVTSAGGTMTVYSKVDSGSCFSVSLPQVQHLPAQAPAKTTCDQLKRTAGDLSVLVVDDEESVRKAISRALRAGGFQTHVVSCGMDALCALESDGFPSVDCVVLDLSMPGMSGRETLSHIRRLRPSLPVVICSGFSADLRNLQTTQDDQLTTFLPKPFRLAELLDAVVLIAASDLAVRSA